MRSLERFFRSSSFFVVASAGDVEVCSISVKPSCRRRAYCVRVMTRSPTRMTIASTSWAAVSVAARGGEDECENRFLHAFFFDVDVGTAVAVRTENGVGEEIYSFSDFGKPPVYLKGRRLVRTATCSSERALGRRAEPCARGWRRL